MNNAERVVIWVDAGLGTASFSCAAQTVDGASAYVDSATARIQDGHLQVSGQLGGPGGVLVLEGGIEIIQPGVDRLRGRTLLRGSRGIGHLSPRTADGLR